MKKEETGSYKILLLITKVKYWKYRKQKNKLSIINGAEQTR